MKTPQVNDIFCCQWGYGQTNVDFYQIVQMSDSKKTIWVRQLDEYSTDENGKKKKYSYRDGEGYTMPIPNKFVPVHNNISGHSDDETPIKKQLKVDSNGDYYFHTTTARSMVSGRVACAWSGKPVRESWYY